LFQVRTVFQLTFEREVHGHFDVRVPPADEGEPAVATVVCDGRQVYADYMPWDLHGTAWDLGDINASADLRGDGCRETSGTERDRLSDELFAAWAASGAMPKDKVATAPPVICPDEIRLFIQSRLPVPGANWTVKKTRQTGRIEVLPGR
jgi:hypothetical protein